MKIKLYQIEPDRDKEGVSFMGYDFTVQCPGGIDPSVYSTVFDGTVDCAGLEDVYLLFNSPKCPPTLFGHSLSVSDIVEVQSEAMERDAGDSSAQHGRDDIRHGIYFCDNIGYKKLEDFDTAMCQPLTGHRMLVVEPHKPPYEATVPDDYRAIRQAVCGTFECVYQFDDNAFLYCNDMGKQIVTVRGKMNFGFLGFRDGENKYTYPQFDEGKVRSLYAVLAALADYIVIDCTSRLANPLSRVAVKEADEVIRLASPDLKSISYYSSQLPLYAEPEFRLDAHIQGLNIPDADLYMPIDEAKAHLSDLRFTIPFSRAVKQQMLDGHLYEAVNDKKFNAKFKAVAGKVV